MTAATTIETAAGAGVAQSERFRKETPRPHHAPRGRKPRRARAEGDAGARSTGATTETTDHEPREASASLLTTQARGQRGRRHEARTTTEEALRPEAARPTTTARAAKRAADETRPGLGREAHEAHRTNATCALHDGAPTSARRLRPRRRLRRPTAKTNRQREVEACVSENVTYVRGA